MFQWCLFVSDFCACVCVCVQRGTLDHLSALPIMGHSGAHNLLQGALWGLFSLSFGPRNLLLDPVSKHTFILYYTYYIILYYNNKCLKRVLTFLPQSWLGFLLGPDTDQSVPRDRERFKKWVIVVIALMNYTWFCSHGNNGATLTWYFS